jgi:streptomycin 6-kinase
VPLRVPDDLVRTVTGWAGDAGAAWLAALPSTVAALAERWSLEVGEPYQPSGMTALAVRVTRADGTPAVLKVRVPEDGAPDEAVGLRHVAGDGAVLLYESDGEALLLERCEPGTPLLDEPDEVAARGVAEILRTWWRPAPPGLRSTDAVAADWAARIAAAPPRLRDAALAALPGRYEGEPMLLHGDLHPGNVLRAQRRPWLAIDPKPKAGDPAYDLAAVLRDRVTPENAARRLAIVTEVTGIDPARARGWALAQAVEGLVWAAELGIAHEEAEFGDAAECLAAL